LGILSPFCIIYPFDTFVDDVGNINRTITIDKKASHIENVDNANLTAIILFQIHQTGIVITAAIPRAINKARENRPIDFTTDIITVFVYLLIITINFYILNVIFPKIRSL